MASVSEHKYVLGTKKFTLTTNSLRIVPHFSSGIVERGVIFTRACVSLTLLSLRKNEGLLVVYPTQDIG